MIAAYLALFGTAIALSLTGFTIVAALLVALALCLPRIARVARGVSPPFDSSPRVIRSAERPRPPRFSKRVSDEIDARVAAL